MTASLQASFARVDHASPTLARDSKANIDSWRMDDGEVLVTIKAAQYAHSLRQLWTELSSPEKQNFFAAVEAAVAAPLPEPYTVESSLDDVSTVWCTGFLEALANYLERSELPLAEILTYLGPESLVYLNDWNKLR